VYPCCFLDARCSFPVANPPAYRRRSNQPAPQPARAGIDEPAAGTQAEQEAAYQFGIRSIVHDVNPSPGAARLRGEHRRDLMLTLHRYL